MLHLVAVVLLAVLGASAASARSAAGSPSVWNRRGMPFRFQARRMQ